MIVIPFFPAAVAILMSFCLSSSAHAAAPEEQLIDSVQVALVRLHPESSSALYFFLLSCETRPRHSAIPVERALLKAGRDRCPIAIGSCLGPTHSSQLLIDLG